MEGEEPYFRGKKRSPWWLANWDDPPSSKSFLQKLIDDKEFLLAPVILWMEEFLHQLIRSLHPRNLTWKLKISPWKRKVLLPPPPPPPAQVARPVPPTPRFWAFPNQRQKCRVRTHQRLAFHPWSEYGSVWKHEKKAVGKPGKTEVPC